jgi:outer membrane protein assembly factor BamB
VAAAALLIVAMAPVAGAAPFLQAGVNEARTGATTDPGPPSLDLAFNTTLDPSVQGRPWGAFPIILDGAVYVVTGVEPLDSFGETDIADPGPSSIDRVDLATGERRLVKDLGSEVLVSAFASDGQRLFVVVDNEVHALHPAGDPAWDRPFLVPAYATPGAASYVRCNAAAVTQGILILPCHQVPDPDIGIVGWLTMSQPFVLALDAATGRERWVWTPTANDLGFDEDGLDVHAFNYSPGHLTVGEGKVFVTIRGVPAHATSFSPSGPNVTPDDLLDDVRSGVGRLVALDAATREVLWQRPYDFSWASELGRADPRGTEAAGTSPPGVLHAPGVLYTKQTHLEALDPATGAVQWAVRLVPTDGVSGPAAPQTGNYIALYADRLFATAFDTLYAVDVRTHTIAWQTPLPEGEDWASSGGLVIAGGRVYGATWSGSLFAFDAGDGSILDRRELGADPRFAIGEGVLAALGKDGRVFVLGSTEASILPGLAVSQSYPAPGDAVRVDLSGTRPGLLSPSVEARIDWGDGTLTPWTAETLHEHSFATAGDYTVGVRWRNEWGQEASASSIVHVGGVPPRELNLMQRAFEPENLDTTWGLIGLAVVFVSALFAVWTRRRHHSTLGGELAQLRAIREAGVQEAAAAARTLDAYERRIADALTSRRLTDAQFSVLMMQATEVRRSLRKRAVAPLAGVVSAAFRTALDASLEDGRITRAEAEALRRALAKEKGLPATRRKDVLRVIDAWGDGA